MQSVRALLIDVDAAVGVGLEESGITVDHVGSIDEVDDGDPIHCVVAAVDGSGDPAFGIPDIVRERNAQLPVVLVGDQPLSAIAADVLAADVETYVRLGAGAEQSDSTEDDRSALVAAIDDAARAYRKRLDRTRVHEDIPDTGVVVRDGRIAAGTPSVAALFGVDEAVGRTPADLVSSDDRDALDAALSSADGTTRELWVTPVGDARRTVELRFRRSIADGAVVARARDVTDEADERSALADAAEQLDSLLKHVPMSIYFKDSLGRHERASEFITQFDPEDYIKNDEGKVHPHPDDVVGKTDYDLYAPEFAEETYADDMEVIQNEEHVVSRIESGTTSLGEDLYTSTTKVPRYDENDEVVGLVGVTVDVTDQVTHQQELERQNERLNEFAEVLTHDLRNPLNIANGYLDILSEGYDEQAIAEATSALDRMESLIEEIRAFVLEGRLVDDPESVDLREAAEEAWSTVDTRDAVLEVGGDLPLKADRPRLRRLLENLFRNAIEHGDGDDADGTPLTIRVVAGHTEFAVEDDGAGIPDAVRSEVFERGYTTSDDGTGFGLAIVKNIAEAHGWTVTIEASEDGGARFVFSDVVRAQTELERTIA